MIIQSRRGRRYGVVVAVRPVLVTLGEDVRERVALLGREVAVVLGAVAGRRGAGGGGGGGQGEVRGRREAGAPPPAQPC